MARAKRADWEAAAKYLANHLIGSGHNEDMEAHSAAHLLWLYTEKRDFNGDGPRPPYLCVAEAIRDTLAMRPDSFRALVAQKLDENRDQWQAEKEKVYNEMRRRRAERATVTMRYMERTADPTMEVEK
jgi:hypothetical protein